VVALGVIALLVMYGLAMSKPPLPPEASHSASPSTAADPTSPGAAPAATSQGSGSATGGTGNVPPLEAQVRHVERALQSPTPVSVRVVVTEAELNALMAREGTGDLKQAHAYFGDGSVAVNGQVNWQGRDIWVTVRAHPTVAGGKVQMDVDEVSVGRMPAPAGVREDVARRLSQGMSRLPGSDRLQVQGVTVTPGQMIITGVAGGRN